MTEQSLAVSEPLLISLGDARLELEHELLVLEPGETPPLGLAWTVYGPMTPEQGAPGQVVTEEDAG